MEEGITKNFLWKFAERISAQLVSFIVSLILARLLLPDDYGAVAIVLVFISIANIFVSDGLGTALIQKKDADQLDFSSVLYANIVLSIALYAVLFICAPWISDYYHNPVLKPVIRVISIRLVFAAINTVQQAYISRKMQFRKFFFATIIGTVISAIVGIIIAYRGGGVWALVFQYLSNVCIDTIVLGFVEKWHPSFVFSWKRVVILFSYGWKLLFEGLSNTIANQLRNLVIGKVYTSADLGYYTKAQQFPELIISNISSSIGAVMLPAMSKMQDNSELVLKLIRKSIRVSTYLLFPCFFGLAFVSKNLIIFLLGEKWLGSSIYLKILCFSSLLTVGMYPRHQALKATGRSDVFMLEHMAARIISLSMLFLVYKYSVMAIAMTGVVSCLVLSITVMFTSKKYNNYSYRDQIADVLPVLAMSAVMVIPVFFVGTLRLSAGLVLFFQIASGSIIYFLLSILFKPDGFLYVINFIKTNIAIRRK